MQIEWLSAGIDWFARLFPADVWLSSGFSVKALIAVGLVSLICGAVGSLVVGNRMAFFSDALAHCAFAGVTLGMIISLSWFHSSSEAWVVPAFMVGFGIAFGLAVAFVREKTSLASDTIIGVFFAFAVGFGGMLRSTLGRSTYMNAEQFLWGSPLAVHDSDILILIALAILLAIVLFGSYNAIVLGSFNPSLARSRGVRVRLWNYVFVALLALIVNLSLKAVGALLINALLVVPAATAANLGRGAWQMFWWAIGVSVTAGMLGLWLSNRVELPVQRGDPVPLEPSGTIVVLCVMAFCASLVVRIVRDRRIGQAEIQRAAA